MGYAWGWESLGLLLFWIQAINTCTSQTNNSHQRVSFFVPGQKAGLIKYRSEVPREDVTCLIKLFLTLPVRFMASSSWEQLEKHTGDVKVYKLCRLWFSPFSPLLHCSQAWSEKSSPVARWQLSRSQFSFQYTEQSWSNPYSEGGKHNSSLLYFCIYLFPC